MSNTLDPKGKPVESTRGGGRPAGLRLSTANRGQVEWRMVDPDSLLPGDHTARAMWSLLEGLDLSRFYEGIEVLTGQPGRPAIDPKILLCLWLYATSEGVGSARAIERLCGLHDAYRWICGGVSVNYHSLSDFRVAHGDALIALFTELLAVMIEDGLVTLYRVAQDGMRVRASAGASSFHRKKTLKRALVEARRQVQHVNAMADVETDLSERQRAAQARAAREQKEKVQHALSQLRKVQKVKKDDPEEARASTTDPEARVMKMPDGGFRPAYNVQLATDVDGRAIVGVSVTQSGSDAREMMPMLKQIEEHTGQLPREHLVDGGYVKLDAIEQAARKGVAVFAPVPPSRKEGVDPYQAKPHESGAVAEWRERMGIEEAKEVYKDRAATAETTNADLRGKRGLTQFLVRGLEKVTCSAVLAALTYNVLLCISRGVT